MVQKVEKYFIAFNSSYNFPQLTDQIIMFYEIIP